MISKNYHYKVHQVDTIISSKVLLKNVHCWLADVFFFFSVHQQLMATNGPSYWCYGTMATKRFCFTYILNSNMNIFVFFALHKKFYSKTETFPNIKVARWIICCFKPLSFHHHFLTLLISYKNTTHV